jgi:hypothetical protein
MDIKITITYTNSPYDGPWQVLLEVDAVRHSFSVEIKSKDHLNQVSIPGGPHGEVLLEGDLGDILEVEFVEGRVLVVKGSYGVLRLDLCEKSLVEYLSKPSS